MFETNAETTSREGKLTPLGQKNQDGREPRRERPATISSGRTALKGNDDFLSGKVDYSKQRKKHKSELTQEELIQKQLNTNFRIMEQIRARVDKIVEDPKTAALKPYYPYGRKRTMFS